MNSPSSSNLAATPKLARLLGQLRARLRRQIWMHGFGTVLTVVGVWLVFVFIADWAMHVPRAVRWFHLLVFLALPIWLVWREWVRYLRRMPTRDGLALLVEREHPELRELLVSAVALQQKPDRDADPELVQRVLRDAELAAARLEMRGLLHEAPQRWRLVSGLVVATVLFICASSNPRLSSIFFARLFGGDQPWPQRTQLELGLAGPLDHAHVTETDTHIEARIARGTDVALVVHASGVIPDEVVLHFDGGNQTVLSAATDGTFRTLLRACRESVSLYASGGDDRATRRVSIVVLDPPEVAGLAISIEPPAYANLPTRTEFDRDVHVLAGSNVSVAIVTRPADARGSVRLLPADTVMELAARPFPGPVTDAGNSADLAMGLGFDVVASQSLRFRFELQDSTGLTDPDPGLFSIDVLTDERPEVELISPARLDIETVVAGTLRLSARARDDFGVASMAWRSRVVAREVQNSEWHALDARSIPLPLRGDEVQRGSAVATSTRIDVEMLAPNAVAPVEGDLFELEVRAVDTRPALADDEADPASVGTSSAVRVRVVGADEFLRRLQDRLAKIRSQAAELDELVRRQLVRSRDALAAMESETSEAPAHDVSSLLVGDRRILGDAESLSRELAAALEGVLYARIEEKSGGLLEALDAELAKATGKGFPIDAWRVIADGVRTGRLSAQGLAGQLAGLFELALRISGDDVPEAVAALDRGSRRSDLGEIHAELSAAIEREALAQQHLTELLDKLAEWDNFQSILSLTRDILNRQKSVLDKTVNMSTPEKK